MRKKVGVMSSTKKNWAPNLCCTSRAIETRKDLFVSIFLLLVEKIYRNKIGIGVFTRKGVVLSE